MAKETKTATAEKTEEKITKMDAVRAALKELGDEAKLEDYKEWIVLKYGKGYSMENTMLSAYKSKILSEERGEEGATKTRKRKESEMTLTDLRSLKKALHEKELKLDRTYEQLKLLEELTEQFGSVERICGGIKALYEFEYGNGD